LDPGVLVAAVPELVVDGSPPPDSVPLGEGDPEVGDPDGVGEFPLLGDGFPDGDADRGELDPGEGDLLLGEGDPDCGEGEPGGGEAELDWGGGLPDPPVGGGGACGGWCRKIRMAISTPRAASSSINSQETRMVRQPARSYLPGQGSGHSRVKPGLTRSIQ
jgi:hypothetical protein